MKKNLLYVFADQWRAHAIGAAMQDSVITPNMDAFAKDSFHFSNAISTYPLCSPHRASLLTGKYPYSCGMWTNCKIGLDEIVMLKPQEITISDVLHKQGYQTAYIGKWHLDASEMNFHDMPSSGAVHWDAYTPSGERRHHFDYWYSYGAMDNHLTPHYWKDTDQKICVDKWSVEHETDIAIEYLKNRDREKPFCMFVSWNPPHPPYDLVPEKYYNIYKDKPITYRENVPEELRRDPDFQTQIRQYFGAITGVDENFGRLMEFIKNEHLLEDTIIILSADHGDCMGSHGITGKNIWYEESIQIPFYIGGAGLPSGESDALFSSQDHMPTLLDLLDTPIPHTVEGKSFASKLMQGNNFEEPEHAFLCMIPGMPDLISEYRKSGLNNKAFGWRGIKTKQHTYIVDNGTSPGQPQKRYLYDIKKDPYQMNPKELSKEEAVSWDSILKEYLQQLKDPFLL